MYKKIIIFLSLFLFCISFLSLANISNNIEKKLATGSEIIVDLDEQEKDIMLYFKNMVANENDLKEFANLSQKRVIDFLEEARKNNRIKSYESFYISNSINLILEDMNLIEELKNFEEIEFIEENSKINIVKDKVEPIKKTRFFSISTFSNELSTSTWAVKSIGADKVWNEYDIDGSGVVIGILDTGVNYKLDELKDSYLGYNSDTGVFDDTYYRDFTGSNADLDHSLNSHGTAIASLMFGKKKQGLSYKNYGVAKGAKFISAKAIHGNTGKVSDFLRAGEWLLEKRPDIINNSWGGIVGSSEASKRQIESIDNMIKNWQNAGIITVFAAGNDLSDEAMDGSITYPAKLSSVFSVGAIDEEHKIWKKSQRGHTFINEDGYKEGINILHTNINIKPDIVAPGARVNVINNKGFTYIGSGTSYSTALVSAAIALLKQANPSISANEVYELLKETAKPLTDEKYIVSPNIAYGYGAADIYKAVSKIKDKKEESSTEIKDTNETDVNDNTIETSVKKDNENTHESTLENKEENTVINNIDISSKGYIDVGGGSSGSFSKGASSSFGGSSSRLRKGSNNSKSYHQAINLSYLKGAKVSKNLYAIDNIVYKGTWKKENEKWYLFNENGEKIKKSLANIENKWYLLSDTGIMQNSWVYIGDEWYYFNVDGNIIANSWIYIEPHWYYLKEDGKMAKAWLKYKNKWYYLNSNGEMLKNTTYLGYSFDNNGAMLD